VNDLDYMNAAVSALRRKDTPRARRLLQDLPTYEVSSAVFRNNGDLTFADMARQWGIERPAYSYGAAYGDLDNDGRLDLVVNNVDAAPFVYQSVAPIDEAHHYLQVRLVGEAPRQLTAGIGAHVTVTTGGKKQHVYHTPYRGYMSTMDDRAHIGLGRAQRVDSLEIQWPDGRYQLLTGLAIDRLVVIKQSDAVAANDVNTNHAKNANHRNYLFEAVDSRHGLKYTHPSDPPGDYGIQPLLPYAISKQGPPLAVGDVDGDALDDVFIGGKAGAPGKLFLQRADGGFVEPTRAQPWAADSAFEDWGATLFDANADGLLDLYVASGAYHVAPGSRLLQDRLYINRGGGQFARDARALPPMLTSTAAVRVGDFTGDDRPDLFVGGRLTPRKYPYPARSYLLRNDGGSFTDVTEQIAPELVSPGGMITDAVWVDFDGDGRLDLVTVGEWMPIQFYRNEGKALRNVTQSTRLPPSRGWWYSVAAADFDGDGDPDLVAGNLGLNYSYKTSADRKFGVYANNFTGNQTTDIVLTQTIAGTEYSLAGLAPLGREIYSTAVKFPTYGSFARASVRQLFSAEELERALHYEVDTFASVYLRNDGGGKFTSSALPGLAQISPIKAIIAHDVDADGHRDLIVGGNLYDPEPNTPRADAGNGLWLRGDGQGHFTPVPPGESGFLAPLNVAGLSLVRTPQGTAVLVANTGDALQVFAIKQQGR
jgi:enediyne biosynthesis protein E4